MKMLRLNKIKGESICLHYSQLNTILTTLMMEAE